MMTTRIMGTVIVTPLKKHLEMRDFSAGGFAAGVTAHGIRGGLSGQRARGTFVGIGMGLNGALTALLISTLALLL